MGIEATARWLGVGHSNDADAGAAARQAFDRALTGDDLRLLLVFASESYDLGALAAALDEASGGVPLVGCSTAGEISTGGPSDAGLVVVALGGDGFSVATAAVEGIGDRLREAGALAAACLNDVEPRPHRVLILLTDGLAGDQQEIVRGAHAVAGAGVPLVGGCAGDDGRMRATAQLHGSRVLSNAVVAAALASDAPFGIGVRHGWRAVGEPMVVTGSDGTLVHGLDGRPALDVYLERLDAPAEVGRDHDAFVRFAMTHPLGLSRRRGEEQVRLIAGADFEARTLTAIAAVPQGGLAWVMEGDDDSVLAATDAACADALAPLEGSAPIGLVAFDCIARRGVLGDAGIGREVERVAASAGGAPVAGFYTYGEIARTRGVTGFHNQTLVVLAVG